MLPVILLDRRRSLPPSSSTAGAANPFATLLLARATTPAVEDLEGTPDLLAWGMGWLTDQMHANVSQPIIYRRGRLRLRVNATLGRKLLQLSDVDGIRMEWTDADFLIPRTKLVLHGAETLPERGDTVIVNRNGKTCTYEVLAPGAEPPWTWADSYHCMIRIHAKLLSEV